MIATIEGTDYEIPEMWVAGYVRSHGGNARDAARAWHEQAQLALAAESAARDLEHEAEFNVNRTVRFTNAQLAINNRFISKSRELWARAESIRASAGLTPDYGLMEPYV